MNRRMLLKLLSGAAALAAPPIGAMSAGAPSAMAGPLSGLPGGIGGMSGLMVPARAMPRLLNHRWVVAEAQRLAQEPYQEPALEMPESLRDLTYDQYRDIRYRAEAQTWREEDLRFRLDILPAGLFFDKPVDISILDGDRLTPIAYQPDMYEFGPLLTPPPADAKIPFSGFRIRNPLRDASRFDEFMVFQGASYFRAVGRKNGYGLSARGIALGTAQPTGEEFPGFTKFWLIKPKPEENFLVVHALLDGPSLAGAYRFTIRPGASTVVDVEMTVFPRRDLNHIGLAPLTSMFLFNQINRSNFHDFRNAVHDSSGLQVLTGNGEWLWRPLNNPQELQISAFVDTGPRGFGLIQRPQRFEDFQDLESHYERRPSCWVEPFGDWGDGAVELIEIPTRRETDDNIVAFWRPKDVISAGSSLSISYRLSWGPPPLPGNFAYVTSTRTGRSFDGSRLAFVLDYEGIGNDDPGLTAHVTASRGDIFNVVLQPNPETKSPRASFEFDPSGAALSEMRLYLARDGRPVSETWLHRWTSR